ncbi:hypothetical protein F5B20DRAFT_596030 [Whalleya microplaca]|nr:hypothetical protein F5B20DRAFT_596030 [Whalleya microplaca]
MASNLSTPTISQLGDTASVVGDVEDLPINDELGEVALNTPYLISDDDGGDFIDEDDVAPEDEGFIPRPKEPTRSRFRGMPKIHLPGARQIFNWIMGCNLGIDEEHPTDSIITSRTNLNKNNEDSQPSPPSVDDDFIDIGDVQDFCPACSTPYCQALDSMPFRSSLYLHDNDPETHIWYIGDRYVMKETVDHGPPDEAEEVTLVKATQVIRRVTRVPVPTVIAGWREHGKVITIVERVPGERLYDIWWNLEEDDKERIAREVARHIDQWRRLSGDLISNLNGGPVQHHDNLFGTHAQGFGPFNSDEQFWNTIHWRLKEKNIDDEVIQVLKDYMPESGPCVLTHGDLSSANILIHEGKVSAIMGFDIAACLPVWAENVAVHFCACKEDEQWKAMLSRHMKSYARALDWWSLWTAVEDAGSENKAKIPTLIARCRRWQTPPAKKRSFKKRADSSDDENDREARAYQQMMMPEPVQRSGSTTSRRGGFVVSEEQGGDSFGASDGLGKKRPTSFRTELRKQLLHGQEYSELLKHPFWESPVDSQSSDEEDNVDRRRARAPTIRNERKPDRISFEQARRKFEEAGTKDEADEDRISRPDFEKWLQASGRGRKVLPRPRMPDKKLEESARRETSLSEDPTLVKEPSWREKKRSFEGSLEPPKGLRPLSLSGHAVSESFQAKLRGMDDAAKADGGAEASREQTLEETLQSLESGQEDGMMPSSSSEPASDRKRKSILRGGKIAPGSLFSAMVKASAEKGARKPKRSRSEERLSALQEDSASGLGGLRPRPMSMMPPRDAMKADSIPE